MPTYDFKCNRCDHRFSIFTTISERDKVVCPKCQNKEVSQLFTGCSISSKGSKCGFNSQSPRLRGG